MASTIVKPSTLSKYVKSINFGTETKLPMMQGGAINSLVEHYNIPMVKWGFDGSLIGIETKKQFMFWRHKGSHLEFKGLLNKDQIKEA